MKFVVIHNKQIHKELATKYEDTKDKLVKQNLVIAQTEELNISTRILVESSLQILIFIFFDCTFSIFNWSQRSCSQKR